MVPAFSKKKWFSLAMAATLSVGTLLPQFYHIKVANAAGGQDFELRVLHTNDTHAHLDNVSNGVGSNVAKKLTAIKENRNDHTILLDAGDVFSGTPYFTQFGGLADLEFMNMAGYNAMVPGNHEFDKGPAGLAPFIQKAQFPIVSANIDYSGDPALAALYKNYTGGSSDSKPIENGHIYPSIILNVKGEKVGVFGLTTEDTVALSSPGNTVKFQNSEAKAKETVKSLEDQGINKIIALTHLGYDVDQKLAADVPDIDIIVGGHSHTKLDKPTEVDHPGSNNGPTIIVQTGEYADYLGKLDAVFDSEGKLKSYNGELLTVADFKEDTEAKDVLNKYASELDSLKSTIVGKSDVDLVYADSDNNRLVRKDETNLGDLITDGILDLTKEKSKELLSADQLKDVKGYIGLQNGGGIRAGIKKGEITMGDVLTVMPFSNSMVAVKVTGKELKEALENGVSDAPAEKGGFPHVSGMKFTYDPSKPKQVIDTDKQTITTEGQRITDIQIQNADGSYSKVDPAAYYMLGTNSFTADGGDFYYSLKQAKDDGRYYEFYAPDYEVFTNYLKKTGTVNEELQGRSMVPADYAAKSITQLAAPVKDAAVLKLPAVPGAYTVSIKSSDKPDVIGMDGKITPPSGETTVNLVLTVKNKFDGSTADTSALAVTVPAKTAEAPPYYPPVVPTPTPAPTPTPVPDNAPVAGIVTVAVNQLKMDSKSNAVLDLPATTQEIKLPALVASSIEGQTLEVNAGNISMTVPMNTIQQLLKKLPEADQKDSMISLKFVPLAANDAKDTINKGSDSLHANIKAGGDVYDLSLSITAASGKTEQLNQFDQPIMLTLTADPSLDSQFAGIYNLSDDGKLAYTGGAFNAGKMTTSISQSSKYTVLEVKKAFSDVPDTDWAYNAITGLAAKQIVNGTTDTTFEPNRSITRAEFTSLLVKALRLTASGENTFTDVAADKWYAEPIAIAHQAGIVDGKSATTFDPNASITREEMVVMMMKAYQLSNGAKTEDQAAGSFTDQAKISPWAVEAVNKAAALELIHGRGDGAFEPQGKSTRAEAAQVIANLIKQ